MTSNGNAKRVPGGLDEFHWGSLDDDELLATRWFTDSPRSLPNLQDTIPSGVIAWPVLEYQLGPADEAVRCAHCVQHQRHRHGFAAGDKDGNHYLLGSHCGPEAFGADYRVRSNARQKAFRRYEILRSVEEVKTELPDVIEQLSNAAGHSLVRCVRRYRNTLARNAPHVFTALKRLRPHGLTGQILLAYEVRERDTEAEAKRDAAYWAEVDRLAGLNNREHRKAIEALNSRTTLGAEIWRVEKIDLGPLSGAQWLLDPNDASEVLSLTTSQLRGLAAGLQTTKGKPDGELRKSLEMVKFHLDVARRAILLVNELIQFSSPENLKKLEQWVNARIGGRATCTHEGLAIAEKSHPAVLIEQCSNTSAISVDFLEQRRN